MALKEKKGYLPPKKKLDGSPTPISGKVPVSDEIKKKAKELKKQAKSVGILTEEESIALLSQMALGLVGDRFGMDMSATDRIKALQLVSDYHRKNKESGIGLDDGLPTNITVIVKDDRDDARLNKIENDIKAGK